MYGCLHEYIFASKSVSKVQQTLLKISQITCSVYIKSDMYTHEWFENILFSLSDNITKKIDCQTNPKFALE